MRCRRQRYVPTGYEIMCDLGEGYGEAAKEALHLKDRKSLLERLGNVDLVVRYAAPKFDDYGYDQWTDNHNVESIALRIQEGKWYKPGDLSRVSSLGDLGTMYEDNSGDVVICSFLTVEQHEAKLQEERRLELETAASEIAGAHGVSVNSLAFIAAVEAEIEAIHRDRDDWNNPERRMEEWAAVRYNGLGTETYFDDLNFVNGRYSTRLERLEDILAWLAESCPLLWAKHQETKLASVSDGE
jgi:hypothetical protein